MAYKFTQKTSNRQQQTAYILYMIIGSYFHKSICSTRMLETALFMHYSELSAIQQEKLEKKIILDTERKLGDILSIVSDMNCEVFIRRREGNFCIQFVTGFEAVSVVVDRDGSYIIRIHYPA